MLSDNDIMAQSTNATYNYLQQISQLGQLSSQQQLFLQQPQLLVEAKSQDLLDQLYRSNEFQCKFFNFSNLNLFNNNKMLVRQVA